VSLPLQILFSPRPENLEKSIEEYGAGDDVRLARLETVDAGVDVDGVRAEDSHQRLEVRGSGANREREKDEWKGGRKGDEAFSETIRTSGQPQ
jgi:hypothetical protein